jgi:hypothetical protein
MARFNYDSLQFNLLKKSQNFHNHLTLPVVISVSVTVGVRTMMLIPTGEFGLSVTVDIP